MKSLVACLLLAFSTLSPRTHAQSGSVPAAALAAKTVVILNDTHTSTVEDGATEELKEWGHLKVIDDVDAADLVLHFSKQSEHQSSNTQKTDANGNPTDYGFTITSGSTIHMTATTKGGFAPFYSTTSKEGKQKAGKECVQAFISAWQDARQRQAGH